MRVVVALTTSMNIIITSVIRNIMSMVAVAAADIPITITTSMAQAA